MPKEFYESVLEKLLSEKVLNTESSVLVVCGGQYDKRIFMQLGFKNVTIANVDIRMHEDAFKPYGWSFQNSESLTYEDNSFDFVVVHLGLHHCHSPHRALLEMYRVSKKGILAFESRDSILIRIGKRLNLVEKYEISAVLANDNQFGGVGNSQIPNHVYRWTENEVDKTVKSYAPYADIKSRFFYGIRFPIERSEMGVKQLKFTVAKLLFPIAKLASTLFPRMGNLFAFLVIKAEIPKDLHPWLKLEGENIVFNANSRH